MSTTHTGANVEVKPSADHFDRHDTIDGADRQTVVGDGEDAGPRSKLESKIASTAPKDGNLGGRWLSTYTGPRTELTDELNSAIRNRIDAYLLPLIFLIYFSQCRLLLHRYEHH